MPWSEGLGEMERKLPRVSRTFWEIMHRAEILHSERQNQIWRSVADDSVMRKVGKLTVFKIIRHVTQAIWKYLVRKYIVLPTNENNIEEMASNFCNSHGLPQCVSATDGHHLSQVTLLIENEKMKIYIKYSGSSTLQL